MGELDLGLSRQNLKNTYEEAQSFYAQDDLVRACELFKQALQLDMTHFDAMHMYGICLARLKQYEHALACFQSALVLNKNIAALHNNIGLVQDELAMFEDAKASFDQAIRLNSQYVQAFISKGHVCLKMSDQNGAIQSFKSALQIDPSRHAVWHQCVALHVQMQQWSEALVANQHARVIEPSNIDYRYAEAVILNQLGEVDKAKQAFIAMQDVGADGADLARYHLARYSGYPMPDKAPVKYVKNLFDGFAGHFDTDLVTHLNYQVPRLMGDIIHKARPDVAINMLDLGCGTGLVGASLRSAPNRLVGVDLSSKMLAKAKEKQRYHELHESSIDVYLEAAVSQQMRAQFHVITAADVFIYMGDLALVFECVAGLLRANGLFIFSTEDSASEPIFLTPSGRYAHHQTYIDQLANRHGFEIQACDAVDLRMELLQPTRGCIFTLSLQR